LIFVSLLSVSRILEWPLWSGSLPIRLRT
jgi:hypothetical protein